MPIPQYWAIFQISKEFLLVSCTLKSDLSKVRAPRSHLFSSSQLLPWVSRQEVSKRNQPTSEIKYPVKMSDIDISWWLVRTCHPSEQKHSPCLYTALSTTIHSPWPCNMTKVALTSDYSPSKVTQSRWFYLIAIIVGLAIGLVLTQVPNPPRLACACAPLFNAMVTAHLARLWYGIVIF